MDYLQPWILPPGLNILLIACGILIYFSFSRLIGTLIWLLGFISLWLFSTPIVAYKMIDVLQNQYPMLNVESLAKADAIIVLGGGATMLKEYNQYRVSDFTLHRLDYAVFLRQKTQLPLLVSGGKINGTPIAIADLMNDYLQERYQLTALKEDTSLTTADESRLLIPILKEHQIKKIYLVTNAWHMPRSVYVFHCAGIDVIPAPMGYYSYGPDYSTLSFLPNKDALYASGIAMHEYIGLLWYRFHCR